MSLFNEQQKIIMQGIQYLMERGKRITSSRDRSTRKADKAPTSSRNRSTRKASRRPTSSKTRATQSKASTNSSRTTTGRGVTNTPDTNPAKRGAQGPRSAPQQGPSQRVSGLQGSRPKTTVSYTHLTLPTKRIV